MSQGVTDTFVMLGIIFAVILSFVCLGALILLVVYFVEYRIDAYRVKHRFDKKPLAQCYCMDCENYEKLGKLEVSGRTFGKCKCHPYEKVNDNFYCKDAKLSFVKAEINNKHRRFNENDLTNVRFKGARLLAVRKPEDKS